MNNNSDNSNNKFERNQLNIFDYNANIPHNKVSNNIIDFNRPNNSRDMNNSKKQSFSNYDKLNDYTFNNYNQNSRHIPHPLDKPINTINQPNELNQDNNIINKKSNHLDFSQRMMPNLNMMPNPSFQTQNNQFNPIFDRIPTIDTFNQKTKN